MKITHETTIYAPGATGRVSHPDLDITIYDFDTLEKIVESQPAFA